MPSIETFARGVVMVATVWIFIVILVALVKR